MCDVIESGTMGAVSYSHSIVTMVLSRIISDIKRRIGRKSRFFTPPAFAAPLRGGGYRQSIAILFAIENQNGVATRW